MKKGLLVLILLLSSVCANAQRFTVGTNIVDWANYGTINVDMGYALAQHFSVVAGAKVNPFEWNINDNPVYQKQKVAYAGLRIWPWYVNSGMWIQLKGQYADYAFTGVWRPALDQGKAAGAGLAIGYTFMLGEKLNFEIGAGGWGGYLMEHNVYELPNATHLRESASGPRSFYDIDNITAAFVFVF